MSKTRLAHLHDLSDAARSYAIAALTERQAANLSVDRALEIASNAEIARAALTLEEAAQDVEAYWLSQRDTTGSFK